MALSNLLYLPLLLLIAGIAQYAALLSRRLNHAKSRLDEIQAKLESERLQAIGEHNSARRAFLVTRRMWSFVLNYLEGMTKDRKDLAWELSRAVQSLALPVNVNEPLPLAKIARGAAIEALVVKIADPTLTDLWGRRSFVAIHEMLSVLLIQNWDQSWKGDPTVLVPLKR